MNIKCETTVTSFVSHTPCASSNYVCSLAWSVTMWGSHPDEENDDCWTGEDFHTEAEGRACVALYLKDPGAQFVMLEGPRGEREVIKNPAAKPCRKDDDSEWRREIAMQAGMALGCDAYNDEMGYS